jgi:contractile injection system tube protein
MVKVVIQSYDNNDFLKEDTSRRFQIPVNPETYTKNFAVALEKKRAHGKNGTDPRYISTEPEQLKLDFILDGTNTIEGYVYQNMTVEDQLNKFLNCAYNMDQKIHRPRFLVVIWGGNYLKFKCVLSDLDINHTLFNPDGKPLRIKIGATFLNYKNSDEQAQTQGNSPDLTHYRLSKQDDRLDLLTYDIYNDSSYFMQIARVNNLSSIRNIKAGTDLYFPPFDKNNG